MLKTLQRMWNPVARSKAAPAYQAQPLYDAQGQEVPWAKHIRHSVIEKRMMEKGMRFRKGRSYALSPYGNSADAKPLNIDDAKAFISGTRAQAQIMGNYILDTQPLPKDKVIPIIYPPDSGIVTAKGIGQALKNRGYQYKIFPAESNIEWNGVSHGSVYQFSAEMKQMAKEAGHVIICDGTLSSGTTLSMLLDSASDSRDPLD